MTNTPHPDDYGAGAVVGTPAWAARQQRMRDATDTPRPAADDKWSPPDWLTTIPSVIAVCAVVGASVWGMNELVSVDCDASPNGPGCVNGHEIRDDVDQAVKDQNEADAEALGEAITAVCAQARQQGDDSACTR